MLTQTGRADHAFQIERAGQRVAHLVDGGLAVGVIDADLRCQRIVNLHENACARS
jgi:hypothetical protein